MVAVGNQELLPGTPAKPSQAGEPINSHALRLMGAGLDHDVKISPLHAAAIMSAIANGGRMMVPGLTSSIVDEHGVEKEITGVYNIESGQLKSSAQFEIKLSDFNIDIPVYLGVKVADVVKINVFFDKMNLSKKN